MWIPIALAVLSAAATTSRPIRALVDVPPPPYVQLMERQPYGVRLRVLLAQGLAEQLREIHIDAALVGTQETKPQSIYPTRSEVRETSDPNVRLLDLYLPDPYGSGTQTLALRFKLETTNDQRSAWSQTLQVPSAAPFREVPTAPTALAVRATSPFAFELSWIDNTTYEHGFEIERCNCGRCASLGRSYPSAKVGARMHLPVGGVLPGTAAAFRVRAFNPLGTSKWTNLVSAKTPTLTVKLKPLRDGLGYGQCTTLASLRAEAARTTAEYAKSEVLRRFVVNVSATRLGKSHPVHIFSDPAQCGSAGCEFSVYANIDGCLRLISTEFREAFDMGDDWPILTGRWHAGVGNTYYSYSQMIDGRYQTVDSSFLDRSNLYSDDMPANATVYENGEVSFSCGTPKYLELPRAQ